MKRILIFLVIAGLCGTMLAQNIDFYSEAFEHAVKNHLGLDENASVSYKTADTLTILNVSGYDIEDIRDIVYFPTLQELNLAYNALEDIAPLIPLDQLRYLDVSGNRLKSIDALAFSESQEMLVNVNGNYITEYSMLLGNPDCLLTVVGLEYQKPPYRVNRFYTDFDMPTFQKIISYNVWTYNVYDSVYLAVDGFKELILHCGEDVRIQQDFSDNAAFLHTDNHNVDTVYFVAPQRLEIREATTALTPTLPKNNRILSAEASKADVTFTDNAITYTKSISSASLDTVRIGFGINDYQIKGYTYYFINSVPTGNEYMMESDRLTVYPNPADNTLTVDLSNLDVENATITLTNLNGQIMYRTVTNEKLFHIDVQHLTAGFYILKVQTADKQFIEKIIKR